MPRLGVVGTMVWDTIHARDVGRHAPIEEWGGIAYALSAADAALGDGWEVFPIIKVGADQRRQADDFFSTLVKLESLDGVRTVPETNNRVELHYHDARRRCEHLTGGVPGWSGAEIWPLIRSCDALYVNFIAGWELDLAAAAGLRAALDGPIYADLHSLLLDIGPDGVRALRPLREWREWLACFDIVQMNEDELATMAGDWGDPWQLVAEALGRPTGAILVTLAERGAAWMATEAFLRDGSTTTGPDVVHGGGAVVTGKVDSPGIVDGGDPTGCGDVWGITCFSALIEGRDLESAVARANRFAARTARVRGASGLAAVLRGDGGLLGVEGGR